MISQVRVNGKWTDKELKPEDEGKQVRYKIPAGKKFGYIQQEYRPSAEGIKIRIISKRALMRRFTAEQRKTFRESVDPIVIDIREDMNLSRYINLDLDDYDAAVNFLLAKGDIDEGAKARLIADGTEDEKYNGAL